MEIKSITEFEEITKIENNEKETIIFKYSPICPISKRIEKEFDKWFEKNNADLNLFKINVISARQLSNHIAKYFSITHESPQLIWLTKELEVKADNSHYEINEGFLNTHL